MIHSPLDYSSFVQGVLVCSIAALSVVCPVEAFETLKLQQDATTWHTYTPGYANNQGYAWQNVSASTPDLFFYQMPSGPTSEEVGTTVFAVDVATGAFLWNDTFCKGLNNHVMFLAAIENGIEALGGKHLHNKMEDALLVACYYGTSVVAGPSGRVVWQNQSIDFTTSNSPFDLRGGKSNNYFVYQNTLVAGYASPKLVPAFAGIDFQTGNLKWVMNCSSFARTTLPLPALDGSVAVGSSDKYLTVAINVSTGAVLWNSSVYQYVISTGNTVVASVHLTVLELTELVTLDAASGLLLGKAVLDSKDFEGAFALAMTDATFTFVSNLGGTQKNRTTFVASLSLPKLNLSFPPQELLKNKVLAKSGIGFLSQCGPMLLIASNEGSWSSFTLMAMHLEKGSMWSTPANSLTASSMSLSDSIYCLAGAGLVLTTGTQHSHAFDLNSGVPRGTQIPLGPYVYSYNSVTLCNTKKMGQQRSDERNAKKKSATTTNAVAMGSDGSLIGLQLW